MSELAVSSRKLPFIPDEIILYIYQISQELIELDKKKAKKISDMFKRHGRILSFTITNWQAQHECAERGVAKRAEREGWLQEYFDMRMRQNPIRLRNLHKSWYKLYSYKVQEFIFRSNKDFKVWKEDTFKKYLDLSLKLDEDNYNFNFESINI